MKQSKIIAVDLAKDVFEVAIATRAGRIDCRKRLSRSRFRKLLANEASALLGEIFSSKGQHGLAITKLKLENEGWERDYDVPEPAEPSFDEPAA